MDNFYPKHLFIITPTGNSQGAWKKLNCDENVFKLMFCFISSGEEGAVTSSSLNPEAAEFVPSSQREPPLEETSVMSRSP